MQVRKETIDGQVRNDHDRPPRKFAAGRECAEYGCGTRLSIYNKDNFCSLHAVSLERIRGKKSV